MATTRLMPLHTGKGRTVGTAISDIIDYVQNPQKTDNGRLITSYQCDSRIADAEFLFNKRQYIAATGRVRGEDDVIAYHLRQSFVPGEITPEEANRLGCELARRFTKGKHAFIVCTHIDKKHKLLEGMGCEVSRRGQSYSLKAPGWDNAARMSKKLGKGYSEAELRAVLAGEKEHTPTKATPQPEPKQAVSLMVDIQEKLRAGKGAGYQRWATGFNLKQMAQTMNYLSEHKLLDYKVLSEKTAAATARYNELSAQIKAAEKRMTEIAVLRTHIINYAKTREVYVAYRKAGYSKKFRAEHEADILLHQTAKKAFDELGMKKLPTVKSLQAEYAELMAQKKAAYSGYRQARDEMRELLTVKANVDRIMGYEEEKQTEKDHAQEQSQGR